MSGVYQADLESTPVELSTAITDSESTTDDTAGLGISTDVSHGKWSIAENGVDASCSGDVKDRICVRRIGIENPRVVISDPSLWADSNETGICGTSLADAPCEGFDLICGEGWEDRDAGDLCLEWVANCFAIFGASTRDLDLFLVGIASLDSLLSSILISLGGGRQGVGGIAVATAVAASLTHRN